MRKRASPGASKAHQAGTFTRRQAARAARHVRGLLKILFAQRVIPAAIDQDFRPVFIVAR